MKASTVLLIGAALVLRLTPPAQAQRVLLRADVAEDTIRSSFGPNRTYYNHFYLGYAAVVGAPAGAGAALEYGKSGELFLGLRNKFRLSQAASVGLDLRYARLSYHLKQNSQKVLPDAQTHYREYVALPQLQSEAFVRLNYGRRGNAIGRYLDLTGWGGWVASSVHHYEDRGGAAGAKRTVASERGLNYVRRWTYGVGARLGSGRYALVGRYRLSDTFTRAANSAYPELPRWTVGIELGWL
ncbi:hypothetical protein [Hymenobacter jejuensis]|uniref:PorT family protein n=1 Tax=Hymenobacter jejuensis TaxID=2502781 RepID=A0A5B8A6V7_9BACT|nr:hypothetical protein [Hymenobacter jejuensis]QDA62132.1 hypothetical protein FHG12_19400 [Hymenobacter jejuensis]